MSGSAAQRVYFDESGFTGSNLLHPHQPVFAYSSIASDDDEARDFVFHLTRKYNIQRELKGSRLVRFSKGRRAIDEIFERFAGRIKVSISNKKYALACKLFEYIFEPCISENNFLFYEIDFHRFIANILYIEFVARGAGAEEIFVEFEELMRIGGEANLNDLFASSVRDDNSPILVLVREFALSQREAISRELSSLVGTGPYKWILDLTDSALFSLLTEWGTQHELVTAICDESKPLRDNQELYNAMIGRSNRVFTTLGGRRHAITFGLSGPIQLVDSKVFHGVQLADAISAACVYAASGAEDDYGDRWRHLLPQIAVHGSVIPDLDHVDLKRPEVQRNVMILHELHERSVAGLPLLDGMSQYVEMLSETLARFPMRLGG